MYPTVDIKGQRVNLNNIAGFTESGKGVIIDLNGGMDKGESPYIIVRAKNKNEQTQILDFLDQQMKVIRFVPITKQD
jgi:hypothetical protein